ncbi:MAG: M48 family metalloprotease [Candidatus Eremiobacteraeota bacterium]|nr:M48 family metalloprotease [Candidatus Eremiobacteraeota bacterium]MBV8281538.1 M48 family metalloprotease [Candidatus Eremiobacteraeota bacterium]
MSERAHTPGSRLTRRCFLGCLRGVALSASALAALPDIAAADDHAQERGIGQQVYQDQRKQGLIIDTSPYYDVLREVGGRISDAAAPHWYTMNWVIVKGTQANAFSVPGGWVYVNEALLRQAESREELASVLGHETGHLVLGHVMNRITQQQNIGLLFALGSLFVHTQGAAEAYNLAQLGAGYGFLNFDRQQEYQADHEGVILANKAHYDPWGMIWFFRRLEKLYGDAGFEQYVQDHPSTNDRVARIESFFASQPQTFAHWSSTMVAHSGLPLGNTNSRLLLASS